MYKSLTPPMPPYLHQVFNLVSLNCLNPLLLPILPFQLCHMSSTHFINILHLLMLQPWLASLLLEVLTYSIIVVRQWEGFTTVAITLAIEVIFTQAIILAMVEASTETTMEVLIISWLVNFVEGLAMVPKHTEHLTTILLRKGITMRSVNTAAKKITL